MKTSSILGLMSGTSLDGLDLALCKFSDEKDSFYEIVAAETIPYSTEWKTRLKYAPDLSGLELAKLNHELGVYFGRICDEWLKKNNLKADAISSHGHTIFHQPEKRLTLQIGEGSAIAAQTGITTVCDFRTLDVNLGGQGAPLVPAGDKILFSEYDACLNLGGFANISFDENGKRIAFDICPVNIALNHFSSFLGHDYDENGNIAQSGNLNLTLLNKLNSLEFYKQTSPKSLGREWFEKSFLPMINNEIPNEDILNTICHHIAEQIAISSGNISSKMLVTGGGAFNKFLIQLLKEKSSLEIIIPESKTINFKEALIFAWLGYMRINNRINTLSSVTGAIKDSCGGSVYL